MSFQGYANTPGEKNTKTIEDIELPAPIATANVKQSKAYSKTHESSH